MDADETTQGVRVGHKLSPKDYVSLLEMLAPALLATPLPTVTPLASRLEQEDLLRELERIDSLVTGS